MFIIQLSESFFRGKIDRNHLNFFSCLRFGNGVPTHVRDPRAYTRDLLVVYVWRVVALLDLFTFLELSPFVKCL